MKKKILEIMYSVSEESGFKLVGHIDNGTVLLDTGLDSIGFAILVARLEEELGYDPFTLMEDPFYPRTFGEFVEIYRRYAP